MKTCVSASDSAAIARRLADAEEKLHLLRTGRLSVEVEHDGRRVRYARVEVEVLQAYVDKLRDEAAGRRPRYGAIGILFGG